MSKVNYVSDNKSYVEKVITKFETMNSDLIKNEEIVVAVCT